MQEKYGFVYIWRDRKRNMYYIGCHWGTEDDGYICSSDRMRESHRRRPGDFKRKILTRVSDRSQLFEEEFKWLQLISRTELGSKYYNMRNTKWEHWSQNESSLLTVGQKISASPLRTQRISEANIGRICTPETREKLRQANLGKKSSKTSDTLKELWKDPEYRKLQTAKKKGRKQSPEQIQKRLATIKERYGKHPGPPKGITPWNKGLKI